MSRHGRKKCCLWIFGGFPRARRLFLENVRDYMSERATYIRIARLRRREQGRSGNGWIWSRNDWGNPPSRLTGHIEECIDLDLLLHSLVQTLSRSSAMARAMSGFRKTEVPATSVSAPAATTSGVVVASMPPSTWRRMSCPDT
jgi:hypothetical protein